MTERGLTEILTRVADQARPARIAPDTWRKGVRRRRARVAGAALTVVMLVAGLPLLLLKGVGDEPPAPADPPRPVVPSTVYSPVIGQDTIVDDPPGRAAIVVSGDQELRGSDIWGWEGRSLVVGRNGGYRLARTVGETSTGIGDLLISPDGRYLAGMTWLESAGDAPLAAEDPDAGTPADGGTATEGPATNGPATNGPLYGRDDEFAVFDLTTGDARRYRGGGVPMLWAPDGRSVLVRSSEPGGGNAPYPVGTMRLIELETGRARVLPRIEGRLREGNAAAFAPDGRRLAIATTDALHVVDLAANRVTTLAELTERDRIAGPGAWLPDGERIAMYFVGGCMESKGCDETQLGQRLFQVAYRDARTGGEVDGPALAPAQGLAARMLGWQRDGAAVVAVYSPEEDSHTDDAAWSETDWWAVGGVELKRFGADGGQRRLVDLPESALFVDVPTDLLDRFGGPSPSAAEGAVRWLLSVAFPLGQVLEAFILVAAVIAGLVLRRGRRARRRARGRTMPAR